MKRHYQRFFCPQCGYPIAKFDVNVGANGYHMEGLCPHCRTRVQGVAELPTPAAV